MVRWMCGYSWMWTGGNWSTVCSISEDDVYSWMWTGGNWSTVCSISEDDVTEQKFSGEENKLVFIGFSNDYLNKVLVLDCRVAVLPSLSSTTCPVMSPPFLSFPLVSILILFSHLTSGSTKRSLSFKVTLHNLRAFQFFSLMLQAQSTSSSSI